jgi:hypothetical protein
MKQPVLKLDLAASAIDIGILRLKSGESSFNSGASGCKSAY